MLPGLFLAAIGIVLLRADWSADDTEFAYVEQREPAAWPEPPRSVAELASYPARFGAFFSDHFGLRREMVRLHGRIALWLQHKSISPEVIVGSDGWMFYAGDGSVENHLHQLPLSPAELDAWSNGLQARHDWFAAHRIAYLFLVAPDKQSIYPEYLPTELAPGPGETRLEQLTRRLAGAEWWLDPRADLLAAKREGELYFKADTHWNDLGAYQTYRAIAARLGIPALSRDEAKLWHFSQSADLARLSGVADTEGNVSYPVACAVDEPATFDPAILDRDRPDLHRIEAYTVPATRCATGRERLLIFHDSFGVQLSRYLSESFARAVYVWRAPSLAQMQAMVSVEHPTVVIEERVERYLIRPLAP